MELKELIKKIEGLEVRGKDDIQIADVKKNSKDIKPRDLFVAISGVNIDGHNFIKDAISKGAKCVVCEKDNDIKNGITKIESMGRLQEIKSGKIKDLIKNNRLLLDGSHNEDGARVLNEYLQTLDCNKHFMIGMMSNKDHEKYISYFKNISSLTTVDIPNQQNAISGKKLKEKFRNVFNVKYEENIEKAIKSLKIEENDILIITGSLYLAGEILNSN